MMSISRPASVLGFAAAALGLAVAVVGPASAQAPSTRPGAPSPAPGPAVPRTTPAPPAGVGTPGAGPGAVGAPAASPITSVPTGTPLSSEYVIGPGDVLQITVWKNETLSRVVPVRPDGKVSMPLLHDVQAAGLTAMQLRDKIATSLGEYLPNPEISVSVNEVRSLRVSVLGEVHRPGVLELRGQTTILEAIAMTGGFRDFASPSKIMIIRTNDNGDNQRLRFNYNKAAAGDEPNLVLRPGDVIIVP